MFTFGDTNIVIFITLKTFCSYFFKW